MKKSYPVEIMGQKFNIKSTESQEYIDKIIAYISEKMRQIAKHQKTMSLHDVAILALLNVTDELFKHQSEVGEYKERVVHKAQNIIRMIDAQV